MDFMILSSLQAYDYSILIFPRRILRLRDIKRLAQAEIWEKGGIWTREA